MLAYFIPHLDLIWKVCVTLTMTSHCRNNRSDVVLVNCQTKTLETLHVNAPHDDMYMYTTTPTKISLQHFLYGPTISLNNFCLVSKCADIEEEWHWKSFDIFFPWIIHFLYHANHEYSTLTQKICLRKLFIDQQFQDLLKSWVNGQKCWWIYCNVPAHWNVYLPSIVLKFSSHLFIVFRSQSIKTCKKYTLCPASSACHVHYAIIHILQRL